MRRELWLPREEPEEDDDDPNTCDDLFRFDLDDADGNPPLREQRVWVVVAAGAMMPMLLGTAMSLVLTSAAVVALWASQ